MSFPILGSISLFAGNFVPAGWAPCDGRLLGITAYPNLYLLIGTTFGGDGVATFALPDLQGRNIIGTGQQTGFSRYVNGETGGNEMTTLTQGQLADHAHQVTLKVVPNSSNTAVATTPEGGVYATGTEQVYSSGSDVSMAAYSAILNTTPTGNSQPFSNLRPVAALKYIISLNGTIPNRPAVPRNMLARPQKEL